MSETTAAAYGIYMHLSRAEIVGATSAAVSRPATVVELVTVPERSFIPKSPWNLSLPAVSQVTAASEDAPIVAKAPRIADDILMEIAELQDMSGGWDGDTALAARPRAIEDAIIFAAGLGDAAKRLDPTLHVDGSVLLEIGDGAEGALLFPGNGTLSYFISGHEPATLELSSMDMDTIRSMIP